MAQATYDKFGRPSYKNYCIESWKDDKGRVTSWSIYNRYNSMYDCKDGFKSVKDAVQYIDKIGGSAWCGHGMMASLCPKCAKHAN